MTTVSVVIPTYNRAALLRETVDSVLAQSSPDIEIVVIDDGSTDDTPAIERDYAGRIVYIRQDNRGLNAARNAAIARARGTFIALLDSDDLHLPYTIELMLSLLERFPAAGFAYTDFQVFRGKEPPSGSGLKSWHGADHRWEDVFGPGRACAELGLAVPAGMRRRDFAVYAGDVYAASLYGPQVLPSASLIRRERMGDLSFPEFDSLCGDWDFFARLSHRHGAVYADVPAALNRSHEDAVRLTRIDGAIQLEKRIALIDRLWRKDPDFLAGHAAEVDSRQCSLLLGLARNRLLAGDVPRAREALARAKPLRSGRTAGQWRVLAIASRVPGATALLRLGRALRRALS